jgi:poly-gamma-glutamate capsule biosynthesis protein CapA/YwtB (metallophosphatase superfamily)
MRPLRLFLCGDVMTGRGIDQALPCPCDPGLHEEYVTSALGYVHLAEKRNGAIPRPVDPTYIWGAAIEEWARAKPDIRIVNLETSITRSEDFADKGINYRMSPENADCLTAAAIDCCVLANNHVLDWGRAGLHDTLDVLQRREIKSAGAGRDLAEARAPAVLPVAGKARVLVFSYALPSSGAPRGWAAKPNAPGINFLPDLSDTTAERVCGEIARARQPGDIVVVSLHWGPNWGYEIPDEQTRFAHALIDRADVSIIHGHSSHHAKAIEVYRNRLILYGCGDFIDDYEGIEGYEDYRDDLALMVFADIDPASGALAASEIVPLQIRHFRLNRADGQDVAWIRQRLARESCRFGTAIAAAAPGRLALSWPGR